MDSSLATSIFLLHACGASIRHEAARDISFCRHHHRRSDGISLLTSCKNMGLLHVGMLCMSHNENVWLLV